MFAMLRSVKQVWQIQAHLMKYNTAPSGADLRPSQPIWAVGSPMGCYYLYAHNLSFLTKISPWIFPFFCHNVGRLYPWEPPTEFIGVSTSSHAEVINIQ